MLDGVAWAEFTSGAAECARGPGVLEWRPFEGGAHALASAGERLLRRGGIALLGTASREGRPRIHPFIPLILDRRLWAFVGTHSPKRRDLEHGGAYTIHALPGAEDEEFWVSGLARRIEDAELRERIAEAMPYRVREGEQLFEFTLELAMWTTWENFGRPDITPVHHRWRLERT